MQIRTKHNPKEKKLFNIQICLHWSIAFHNSFLNKEMTEETRYLEDWSHLYQPFVSFGVVKNCSHLQSRKKKMSGKSIVKWEIICLSKLHQICILHPSFCWFNTQASAFSRWLPATANAWEAAKNTWKSWGSSRNQLFLSWLTMRSMRIIYQSSSMKLGMGSICFQWDFVQLTL